jgi:hypothetical protein
VETLPEQQPALGSVNHVGIPRGRVPLFDQA